jgi:hypothetical protein
MFVVTDAVLIDGRVLIAADEKSREYYDEYNISPELVIGDLRLYKAENFDSGPCEDFQFGLAQIEIDGKWGFVDIRSGEIRIAPQWDFVWPFYHGVALVANGFKLDVNKDGIPSWSDFVAGEQDRKFGFIGPNGEMVVPMCYEYADHIPHNNQVAVKKDGKWGLIGLDGNVAIPFIWNYLEYRYTVDDYYDARSEEGYAMIRGDGSIIIDRLTHSPKVCKYSKRSFSKSCMIIQRGRKFGVVLKDGTLIAAPSMLKREAAALAWSIDGTEEIKEYAKWLEDGLFGRYKLENVPEDKREVTLRYMAEHGMEIRVK